jgi:cytochrome c peroxidase
VKKTAPYFHDNSAKTLEEVAAFYTNLFANNPAFPELRPGEDFTHLLPGKHAS